MKAADPYPVYIKNSILTIKKTVSCSITTGKNWPYA